jgi:hypothetical protein
MASGVSITDAFASAISSLRGCWGRSAKFYPTVAESLMKDRWAGDIVVTMKERGSSSRLCFRLDLALRGWGASAAQPLCGCTSIGGALSRPAKRWVFIKTNKPGHANTLTVECSWCRRREWLERPKEVPVPQYHAGVYFRYIDGPALLPNPPPVQVAPGKPKMSARGK